jgi:hypothetical protein
MVFVAMSVTKAVGDTHPGQWIPFWERACDNGRAYACSHLGDMEANLCSRGSGWACNELGIGQVARKSGVVGAQDALQRGCRLGFRQACRNLSSIEGGSAALDHGPPALRDYPILTSGSKGPNLERTPAVLYNLACTQGWREACHHTGL